MGRGGDEIEVVGAQRVISHRGVLANENRIG